MNQYPITHIKWHPKDGNIEIAPDLWSAITKSLQSVVKRYRRSDIPFRIVEIKRGSYAVLCDK
jgi:hypothetical protein